MTTYLYQARYSPGSIKNLVAHPQDRTAAVQSVVDAVGGTLQGCWFALGEYDIAVIADAKDDTAMAAIAMAVAASGAVVDGRTTRLMSMSDASDAMRTAQSVLQRYAAPSGT